MVTLENSLLLVERCKKFNKDLLIRFDSNFKKNHHLAIEVPGENSSNEWLEPVSDEEYGKLQ